jgi:uncharacterized protein YbjT (DUF2867 family)
MKLSLRIVAALLLAFVIFSIPPTAAAQSNADRHVLVFGGTGRLGSEIVERLIAAGYPVTVFARAGSDRKLLQRFNVSYLEGDALNEADVKAAFEAKRFHAVIDASWGRNPGYFEASMRNIATYSRATGVKQVILHNSVGAGGMEKFGFADFGQVRSETGQVVDRRPVVLDIARAEQVLLTSGAPYTVIRHAVIWHEDTPETGYAWLSEDYRIFTGVTRKDLATLTLSCLDKPACINKVYHAADNSLSWRRPRPGEASVPK